MIWVLAGTRDGRELAADIADKVGQKVLVSTVSEYGGQLAAMDNIEVHVGPLDADQMAALIDEYHISFLIDATHPYAAAVSETARAVCREKSRRYLRYERPPVPLPAYDKLYHAASPEAAAMLAKSLGKTIFLTTGSRSLESFAPDSVLTGCRVIARVLPDSDVLAKCRRLGFTPRDIIAMQGPFSCELNQALFHEYGVEVVVMKNSGTVGGSDTKLVAAIDLGLSVVVIDRPAQPDVEWPIYSSPQALIHDLIAEGKAVDSGR